MAGYSSPDRSEFRSIYAEIDKCVNDIQSRIRERRLELAELDFVRRQNVRVCGRLSALEASALEQCRQLTPPESSPGNGGRSNDSCSNDSYTNDRPDSRTQMQDVQPSHTSPEPTASPYRADSPQSEVRSSTYRELRPRGASKSMDSAVSSPAQRSVCNDNSRFLAKIMSISKDDCRQRLQQLDRRLKDPESRKLSESMPEPYSFPSFSEANGLEFLNLISRLGRTIECSALAEQDHRVRKRIALAQFYHAYTLAQENPKAFLSWCDERGMTKTTLAKRGGYKSIVQSRFVDLVFPAGSNFATSHQNAAVDLKMKVGKIQTWRKAGKPWSKLIRQFGCGILVIVPPTVTDEDVRLATDDEVNRCIDLIDSQKDDLAEVIEVADKLVRSHFVRVDAPPSTRPSTGSSTLSEAQMSDRVEIYAPITVDPRELSLPNAQSGIWAARGWIRP